MTPDKYITNPPPFIYRSRNGDRPNFSYFPESPPPLFAQKYGEIPNDTFRRHVDIGKKHLDRVQGEIQRVAKLDGVSVTAPGRWGPLMVLTEYQQVCFGEKRLSSGGVAQSRIGDI